MLDFTLLGGPYGDATSDYSVRVSESTTVLDFCKSIDPSEWGNVLVNGTRIVEYYRGNFRVVNQQLFDEVARLPIYRASANGGWGFMDYYLFVHKDSDDTELLS